MASFIAAFENPDTYDGMNFFPFEAKSKREALEFLWRMIDTPPIRLYREVDIDGNHQSQG